MLTHLLGQSVEQLAENIERYRTAWREAGHAGEGRVTLMMHTYLDRDADTAREVAREPMKGYLGTAVGLLRDVASAFPTFAGRGKGTDDLFKSLTPDELDQLLEMAAHRYLSSSGLFGTPDEAASIVETVSAAGVDEVACLVDFGIATDDVLTSLDLLLEAKAQVDARRAEPAAAALAVAAPVEAAIDPAEDTVAALVARHSVTHLQCTPSLAAMLVADPADRQALGRIRHLMLGGEALPSALAGEIRALLPGRFTNMYGPTETTIWSLTHELDDQPGDTIPIGTPIGNTTIFVLDPDGRRLPVGAFGELHIGGESVARGYHNRPELTAERFVDRPGMGRVYATGDVVRIHHGGYVEFAGRADNQVKIRGHRIELGEIESVIDRHPDVVQSVVVARDDRGDTRLVAYVVMHHGADATADALRKHVAEVLPEAMVPSAVVRLDAFPLTPNGKIDRKALPADTGFLGADAQVATAPPADDTEQLVADIWSAELERPVGRDDNFFDIGGHSLLAVKVFRRLTDATAAPLALTDIFRFPTVRTFAAHLGALQGAAPGGIDAGAPAVAAPTGADRGAMRRRALSAPRRCHGWRIVVSADAIAPAEMADTDIAIVGMAGRFPGAPTVDELWRRVVAGEDCLVDLSREELAAAGVPARLLDDPEYVRRNGVLDDVDKFDPGFFGIGQRDAAIMDPQHRHFIECCWEALETSGHVPERFAGAIGIFAGCGMNTYMLNNLLTNPTLVEQVGMFLLRHTANDKDFLSTTVSYKLDLRGPSVNVQTACSTSLVAVHLAVQSLLSFECDMALAGGVTIEVPHRVGYVYHEGEVLSPDGYCRAFDEKSAGTVLTSGAAVVTLRRLADAIEDGDPILAVIKGTAINNDGQRKVGYLAPSVDGHADVVKEALAVAGLSGRDIQLLEAHGTGTAVGDPIEVAALTEAFRASTADSGFCRLVSTKPNIGHLDTAAGDGQPDQGRPGAAPPHAAAARQPHRAEPAARPRPHAVRHLHRGHAVARRPAPPRRRQLARRRRHQRPRHRAGGARAGGQRAGRARAGARPLGTRRRRRWPTARPASPTSSRPTPAPTSPTSPTRWPPAGGRWPTAASSQPPTPPTPWPCSAPTTATGCPPRSPATTRSAWRSCSPAAARSTTAWPPGSTSASTSSTR